MSDRSVIHRNGNMPPEGQGGRLIVPIDMKDITGAAMRADHQAVAIKMLAASGDTILLGMSAGGVDAMIDTLTKIRAEMTTHGVEKTIPFNPVHTVQCGTHQVDGVTFVSLILDRSLDSARAYLMAPKGVRVLAKQLVTAARIASSARGEIIGADDGEA